MNRIEIFKTGNHQQTSKSLAAVHNGTVRFLVVSSFNQPRMGMLPSIIKLQGLGFGLEGRGAHCGWFCRQGN